MAMGLSSIHSTLPPSTSTGSHSSFEQITTVWRVVKELRNSPFVSFEQGLKYVGELEECDLAVDPPVLSELIEESEDE